MVNSYTSEDDKPSLYLKCYQGYYLSLHKELGKNFVFTNDNAQVHRARMFQMAVKE